MERGLRKSRVQERSRKTRERKWRLRKRVYIYMDSESHPGRKSWQSHSHGQEHSIKTSEVYQEEMKKQKSLPAVFCGGCFTGLSCLGLPRPQKQMSINMTALYNTKEFLIFLKSGKPKTKGPADSVWTESVFCPLDATFLLCSHRVEHKEVLLGL